MSHQSAVDRFEAFLRREGAWYHRPNVTVHFAEGYGFWDNYKGYVSRRYKTFKGFMKWRNYSVPPEFCEPETNMHESKSQ